MSLGCKFTYFSAFFAQPIEIIVIFAARTCAIARLMHQTLTIFIIIKHDSSDFTFGYDRYP